MSMLLTANKLGNSQSWDIVGTLSKKYYGTLHDEYVVQALLAGSKGASASVQLSTTNKPQSKESIELAFKESLEDEVNAQVTSLATKIIALIKNNSWGAELAVRTAIIIEGITMPATHVSLLAGKSMPKAKATEYLHSMVKNRLLSHYGIFADDPQPNKPMLPEEELEHDTPQEVDMAAVELIDTLLEQTEPVGSAILRRAKAYLENIDEIVDFFRLNNPSATTYAYDNAH